MSKSSRRTAHAREKERVRSLGLTIREYREFARPAGFLRPRPPRPPVDPAVARAAVNLRSAGMTKRDVHRSLARVLKAPPSRKELDAVYLSAGASYRRGPGGRKGYQYHTDRSGKVTVQPTPSRYRARLAVQLDRSVYRGTRGRERLNRAYAAAYLRQQGLDVDLAVEDYVDWVEGRGEGTP